MMQERVLTSFASYIKYRANIWLTNNNLRQKVSHAYTLTPSDQSINQTNYFSSPKS